MEETAVAFLTDKIPDTTIASVLTHPALRGCIYMEGNMAKDMQQFLQITPGVCRKTGILKQEISRSDWSKLLKMKTVKVPGPKTPPIGSWISIKKGCYKGDPGFFVAIKPWGGVTVLLIPRLPTCPGSVSTLKRKRGVTWDLQEPRLFDAVWAQRNWLDIDKQDTFDCGAANILKQKGRETYIFLGQVFQYGLLRKSYDLRSVSSPLATIPGKIAN